MPLPSIAIIGAGPAGLTLARLLQQNQIPCTIYESDASRNARNQGGRLDLHPKSGQQALKVAGLIEEFEKHARSEGECMKIIKHGGTVLWDENKEGNSNRRLEDADRPEIDRVQLRDILLDSLQRGSIQWGRRLLHVEAEAKVEDISMEKFHLHFADGSVEENFDLVIGADGAWSKVRPLLTDEKPFYSGITAIELWAQDVDSKNLWLSEYIGKGSCFMFDEGRALLCQRNGESNSSIRAYTGLHKPETWVNDCGVDWFGPFAREELVKGYFSDCGDDVKHIILESRDGLTIRKTWMLPIGISWESRPGVTLLGDAAHLMTPFAGVGVNIAMADALELATTPISFKDSFIGTAFSGDHNAAAAIKQYEIGMFERGRRDAQKT